MSSATKWLKNQLVKLTPKPGDVLVLRPPVGSVNLSDVETDALLSKMAKQTGCLSVALRPGESLTDMSNDDLAAIGLCQISQIPMVVRLMDDEQLGALGLKRT